MRFSGREHEVLTLMVQGNDEREVARELGLNLNQVSAAWASLTEKLRKLQPCTIDEFRMLLDFAQVEKRRLGDRVSTVEGRLNALMDTAPEAILIVDGRNGKILQVNNHAVLTFGYSQRELIGMIMETLVPPEKREVHRFLREGFLKSVRKRELGYHPPIFAMHKDGSILTLDIALTATTASDEVMVVCRPVEQSSISELGRKQGKGSR